METPYDWLTLAIFAGLIILFLQRSTAETPSDRMIEYAPPAIGCAVANYLGNHDQHALAIIAIVAILVYIWLVLKPLQRT
ncbi:MAG: hypothetical protein EOP89_11630 [Lysobacteraceae bacterium]|nr:MAG: hypothetical protein EOP89_11630 [Xanthomonadaceae bacterium]